ncbi:MAG TPA: amidohydrolase family protein [Melioribacteraceae bacterium]|nr:amidohydrolase family protein [Melioribacteraceae bacterium]
MKILKNVFINTRDNKLKLVNIIFNDTIIDIIDVSGEIDWNIICTLESRDNFVKDFVNNNSSDFIEFNGNYNLLMYGSLDTHVHFNTPGYEHREDIEHASYAAAAGGVTTVIDMPCTSVPPVVSVKNLLLKKEALQGRSRIDYAFWGGISSNNADKNNTIKKNLEYLIEEGVPGFKIYTISGMNTFKDLTYAEIDNIAEIMKKMKSMIAVHAEDKIFIKSKMAEFQFKNRTDWQAYCEARGIEAEVKAVKKLIEIAKKHNTKIHIVHLSSKEATDLIRKAKSSGINITVETCPHYLYFTQNDFENKCISNFLKTAPPVKFEEDKNGLWQGLKDGTIDFVTTDHAGCDPMLEKMSSNFWEVYGGIPGVQHRVPFLLSLGFIDGNISLEKTIKLLNPYEYFIFENKGSISKDFDADFSIINLWEKQKITYESMFSKGKYTPFEGVELKVKVKQTFLRGELIFDSEHKKNENRDKLGKFLKVVA